MRGDRDGAACADFTQQFGKALIGFGGGDDAFHVGFLVFNTRFVNDGAQDFRCQFTT